LGRSFQYDVTQLAPHISHLTSISSIDFPSLLYVEESLQSLPVVLSVIAGDIRPAVFHPIRWIVNEPRSALTSDFELHRLPFTSLISALSTKQEQRAQRVMGLVLVAIFVDVLHAELIPLLIDL
jgi:hypothetical protein